MVGGSGETAGKKGDSPYEINGKQNPKNPHPKGKTTHTRLNKNHPHFFKEGTKGGLCKQGVYELSKSFEGRVSGSPGSREDGGKN